MSDRDEDRGGEPELLYHWPGPPAVRLWRRTVRDGSGRARPAHWLEAGDGSTGAVAVAHDGARLLLIRSPRPAVGDTLLELPRGFGEAPAGGGRNDPRDDALRELREETGFEGAEPVLLGTYVVDSGVYPAPVAAVACRVDGSRAPDDTDGEAAGVRWVPWRDVPGLIASGRIADAHSLSALALAFASGIPEAPGAPGGQGGQDPAGAAP